ncbi:MAG: hypothetical protein OCD02_04400 [Spirochaetaceae bacterium]
MKTLKYYKLLLGITLLIIGSITGSLAKKNSDSVGGIYLFAEKYDSYYFFTDINGKEVYITNKEYINQNTLTWVCCITLVIGVFFIFIFWISLTLYRIKNRKQFE